MFNHYIHIYLLSQESCLTREDFPYEPGHLLQLPHQPDLQFLLLEAHREKIYSPFLRPAEIHVSLGTWLCRPYMTSLTDWPYLLLEYIGISFFIFGHSYLLLLDIALPSILLFNGNRIKYHHKSLPKDTYLISLHYSSWAGPCFFGYVWICIDFLSLFIRTLSPHIALVDTKSQVSFFHVLVCTFLP